ncbi:uncharacterized protein LOC114362673 [Ostrinia furnacalis]|uniref:uncharacterized protein LOC114362673 n=1 Tax=Ostrinia furnacalis TaxID=93504 RepID=UPI00103DC939|nr:uncharacterized protein LOC114362673 [Ostrinia furnacalis]
MESLQQAIVDMQTSFATQMADFQKSLQQATPSTTVAALAAEFAAFKKFTLASLSNLQQQTDLIQRECDRLEMCGRRKILLLHGVPEVQGEEPSALVAKLVGERLHLTLPNNAMSGCRRMGKMTKNKTRPMLVRFRDVADRDRVWFAKTALKGTGITISEFLTKSRHDTFMEARKRVGISKCWTRSGTIVIVAADGAQHRITTLGELDRVIPASASTAPQAPNAGVLAGATQARDAANARTKRRK